MSGFGLFCGFSLFQERSNLVPLDFATNDAIALAHLFCIDLKLIPVSNCRLAISGDPTPKFRELLETLTSEGCILIQPTRISIEDALEDLSSRIYAEDDFLVLSFATHGFYNEGEAYLMPFDGRLSRISHSGISIGFVSEKARSSQASKKILIIDACRHATRFGARSTTLMQHQFKKALTQQSGFVVLCACSDDESAWEYSEKEMGTYSYFICATANNRDAYTINGNLTINNLARHSTQETKASVIQRRKAVQTPWFSSAGDDFVIAHRYDYSLKVLATNLSKVLSTAFAPGEFSRSLDEELISVEGKIPGSATNSDLRLYRLLIEAEKHIGLPEAEQAIRSVHSELASIGNNSCSTPGITGVFTPEYPTASTRTFLVSDDRAHIRSLCIHTVVTETPLNVKHQGEIVISFTNVGSDSLFLEYLLLRMPSLDAVVFTGPTANKTISDGLHQFTGVMVNPGEKGTWTVEFRARDAGVFTIQMNFKVLGLDKILHRSEDVFVYSDEDFLPIEERRKIWNQEYALYETSIARSDPKLGTASIAEQEKDSWKTRFIRFFRSRLTQKHTESE